MIVRLGFVGCKNRDYFSFEDKKCLERRGTCGEKRAGEGKEKEINLVETVLDSGGKVGRLRLGKTGYGWG